MHPAIGYQLATAQIAGHRRQAGSALGSCGARYTLTISAIDLTTATHAWPPRPASKPPTPATAGRSAAPAPTTNATKPSQSPSPAAQAAH